jgi:hypothetical protein
MSTEILDKTGIYQHVYVDIYVTDLTLIRQSIGALAVEVPMTNPNSASLRNKLHYLISLTSTSSTLYF